VPDQQDFAAMRGLSGRAANPGNPIKAAGNGSIGAIAAPWHASTTPVSDKPTCVVIFSTMPADLTARARYLVEARA